MTDFMNFLNDSNVLNFAVGNVVGNLFSKVATEFTNDLISPLLGLFSSRLGVENSFLVVKQGKSEIVYATFTEAQEDGATIVQWGKLAQTVINFLVQAVCIYLVVKSYTRLNSRLVTL